MDDVVEPAEDSLLDQLLVVAENLKILIVVPVVVGLLTFGIGYSVPNTYTSQAIVALPLPLPVQMPTQMQMQTQSQSPVPTPAQAAAMMGSSVVLDAAVRSLNAAVDRPIPVTHAKLSTQVKIVVGKDGLLRLDVNANTPLEAQAVANAVVDAWLKSTVPGPQDRADLEKRLAYAKASLASVSNLLDRLVLNGATNRDQPGAKGETGTFIVALGELQARYVTEVLNIPRILQGLSRDIVVQPPTLPSGPNVTHRKLIAVLAALGTGFSILLWIFLRRSWMVAAKDPRASEKQTKLIAAMGFKTRSH